MSGPYRTVVADPPWPFQWGAVVLDPFAGSGTVGVVCRWHGRDFVGIELNPEYAVMARRRIETDGRFGRAAHRERSRGAGQLDLLGSAA